MSENIKKIKNNLAYLPGTTNIGIVKTENGAVIIDSGSDQSFAKYIYKQLLTLDLDLKAIINTHSNADHIGGNHWLQKKTGCKVMTSLLESHILENPILEPLFLYGANPFKELRNKHLMSKPSKVNRILLSGETIKIDGQSFEIIDLQGHFFQQIGIISEDVLFLGDSLFSEEIIKKYGLFYLYDVQGFLTTLERLKSIKAEWYLPSHGSLTKDIEPLIHGNQKAIKDNIELFVSFLHKPIGFDELTACVTKHFSIGLNVTQMAILNSTIRAYISYLIDGQKVEIDFSAGYARFKSV